MTMTNFAYKGLQHLGRNVQKTVNPLVKTAFVQDWVNVDAFPKTNISFQALPSPAVTNSNRNHFRHAMERLRENPEGKAGYQSLRSALVNAGNDLSGPRADSLDRLLDLPINPQESAKIADALDKMLNAQNPIQKIRGAQTMRETVNQRVWEEPDWNAELEFVDAAIGGASLYFGLTTAGVFSFFHHLNSTENDSH